MILFGFNITAWRAKRLADRWARRYGRAGAVRRAKEMYHMAWERSDQAEMQRWEYILADLGA